MGSARTRRRGAAPLAVQVDAEAAEARQRGTIRPRSGLAVDAPRVRRQRRQHRFLDVDAVERPVGERPRRGPSTRIDGGAPAHEQQIAAAGVRPAARSQRSSRAVSPRGGARGDPVRRVQFGDQLIDRTSSDAATDVIVDDRRPSAKILRQPFRRLPPSKSVGIYSSPSYRGAACPAGGPSTKPRKAAPRS